MDKKRSTSSQIKTSGFTLLELMIGVSILLIAIIGLLYAFVGCFTLNEGARNLTIAINHAQCVMEEIRGRNIPSNITQENWTNWASLDSPAGGGCNTLDNEIINVTYPSGIGANPLEIVVDVDWTEKGRQRNTQLVTLVTER